ncbi:carbohydrate sulfotransferase 8-like [Liolophura sinensis]|uniref:carbohydrate sulfotransferase 8-like n=1 Tax=Liolophura sinensis TaxID=3198878 RepID=UPI0031584775
MKISQKAFLLVLLFGTDFVQTKIMKPKANILSKSVKKVFQIDESNQRVALLRRQCRSPLLKLIADLTTNRERANNRILVDPRHKLSYCNVPKIGSSFWYSAFAVLQDKESVTRSPYDLWNKYGENIHQKVKVTNFKKIPIKFRDDWLQDSLLFLFVRNPYARLFSAYVSKFVIPNRFYWPGSGRVAIRYIRPNPSKFAMKCGHDVTFQEFLKFFLATESPDKKLSSDHHWTPIYKLCNPCSYGYKFIGKTETFLNDTVEIIKRAKLGDKMDFQRSGESAVKADIVKTVEHFLNHSIRLHGCVDVGRNLWRLWYAFKAKGYIKPDSEIPQSVAEMYVLIIDNLYHGTQF